MSAKRIGINHIETIAHQLAVATMSWDEPIPPFKTRYPKVLESCLETPFQTYAGRDLYPKTSDKAAIFFYLLVKNHPFQNLPAPQANEYCIYILSCSDGSSYIGQTSDLENRLAQHNNKQVSWTAPRLPAEPIHVEIYKSREKVVKRENVLKTGYGRKWIKRNLAKFASRQAGGNKRLAVTSLTVFLFLNNYWLTVQPTKLYNLAVWVAQSDTDVRDAVIRGLGDFICQILQKIIICNT